MVYKAPRCDRRLPTIISRFRRDTHTLTIPYCRLYQMAASIPTNMDVATVLTVSVSPIFSTLRVHMSGSELTEVVGNRLYLSSLLGVRPIQMSSTDQEGLVQSQPHCDSMPELQTSSLKRD